jgi:hypothetical protein
MLGIVLNKVENAAGGGYGGRYYGAYYGTYTNDSDKKRGRFSRKVKSQDAKADSKVEVLG